MVQFLFFSYLILVVDLLLYSPYSKLQRLSYQTYCVVKNLYLLHYIFFGYFLLTIAIVLFLISTVVLVFSVFCCFSFIYIF